LDKKALAWIELAIQQTKGDYDLMEYIDTKACLLYKMGNKAAAVKYEEEAMSRFPKYAPLYRDKLEKMKNGGDISMMN
jgi:hypothetical protein